ncbi:MAG TPA: DinB family protein [Edaphobacter sp.]|nr:DinB family protein [Edaphobacter sp.]
MTAIPRWFERTFDFSFPVEMLPNLLARLRGTPARLEEVLRNQPAAVLTAKPESKWSAQENVGHLLNLESLWLARVEDYVRSSSQLTPTDLQNRQTDQANYNALSLEQILHDFRAARTQLLTRIDHLEAALFSQSIPHPRLKTPMRLVDHLFFVAEHDDHHLARIWRLLHPAP